LIELFMALREAYRGRRAPAGVGADALLELALLAMTSLALLRWVGVYRGCPFVDPS
jgi:hypothetical protein